MSPHLPSTLTEFLEDTGARLRYFDVGRRVSPLSREQFLGFEQTELPYPYPMQQKAWFALVQTHPGQERDPLIWFLRFDLDEQGKLVQANRDYLIHRLLDIASERPRAAELGQAMQDNPYAFTPREDKMANLHAMLQRDLGHPPSQYFAHARDYLSGRPGWDQWSFVGYQGLADVAARQDDPALGSLLNDAIPQLPEEPLIALCQCLENHPPSQELAAALQARLEIAAATPGTRPVLLASLLRGLSLGEEERLAAAIDRVLDLPQGSDIEVLAAIGGRAWEALRCRPDLARTYLERLASDAVEAEVFDHCVTDLLRLPGMQQPILDVLRGEKRSQALANAFQRLLQS